MRVREMVLIFCKEKEEGSTDKSSAWTGTIIKDL